MNLHFSVGRIFISSQQTQNNKQTYVCFIFYRSVTVINLFMGNKHRFVTELVVHTHCQVYYILFNVV